jgi:adenylate cyclase
MKKSKPNQHGLFSKKCDSGLYWQLSFTFLAILTLLAVAYLYVTVISARSYTEAAEQRLNSRVAGRIAEYILPFVEDGIDSAGVERIFFNAMIFNPSIEVYLLDEDGRILNFHASEGVIRRRMVAMEPVDHYIASDHTLFIRGEGHAFLVYAPHGEMNWQRQS